MKAKTVKQWVWGIVRLGIGVGIVTFLLFNINKSSQVVHFRVDGVSVEEGAVYTVDTNAPSPFLVLETASAATNIVAMGSLEPGARLPPTGRLTRLQGSGPPDIEWQAVHITPCGLRLLGNSFKVAGQHWILLTLGVSIFLVCLGLTVARWRLILAAQGLDLSWRKAWTIMFIGHFFNAFMFGSTGGDVVKAYYAARETGHKKTEAVSTVFIDRILGLLGLLLLAIGLMMMRVRLYMSCTEGRYALMFIGGLTVAAVGGLTVTFLFQKLVDRFLFVRRLMDTFIGKIVHRVYTSFYVCITHPPLFAKALALSALNQFMIVIMMYVLSRALVMDLSFVDFAALAPTINAIGAVPVTPGGLGLREYAAVTYLGMAGVAATKALPLSLAMYATMLFWSLVGGVVFLLYSGESGGVQALKEASAENG